MPNDSHPGEAYARIALELEALDPEQRRRVLAAIVANFAPPTTGVRCENCGRPDTSMCEACRARCPCAGCVLRRTQDEAHAAALEGSQ